MTEIMENNLTIIESPVPTKYRVSTITCNASITTTINLPELFNNLTLGDDVGFVWIENGLKKRGVYPKKKKAHSQTKDKKCFDNQLTVIYKYADGYYPNIKIFRNGNIQMTGIRKQEDGENIVQIVAKELTHITTTSCPTLVGNVNTIDNKDFFIRMINCDFGVPFKIRRKNLHQLLISAKYGITCSFQPLTYPGVKAQYYWNSTQLTNNGICKCTVPCYGKGTGHGDGNCKKVTIATFDSGKILITGANSFDQVNKAYEFICAVIMDNQNEVKKTFSS
jgi:hypothetical protein